LTLLPKMTVLIYLFRLPQQDEGELQKEKVLALMESQITIFIVTKMELLEQLTKIEMCTTYKVFTDGFTCDILV
jgi:hypothetical protein